MPPPQPPNARVDRSLGLLTLIPKVVGTDVHCSYCTYFPDVRTSRKLVQYKHGTSVQKLGTHNILIPDVRTVPILIGCRILYRLMASLSLKVIEGLQEKRNYELSRLPST